jgi:aspartate carbamoyltransferase catalytic subunit
MHPGPVNYGIEVEKEIHNDSRSVILKQVENGVFIREAIIRQLGKDEV